MQLRKTDFRLLRLAIPVALSQLGVMLMQIVDTLFLGRLGSDALTASAVAGSVFVVALVFTIGLAMGLDFWVSSAIGEKNPQKARAYLIQSLIQVTVVSIPMILGMMWVPMEHSVFALEPRVAVLANQYLRLISSSLWFALVFTVFRQYLQACHRVRGMVILMIVANILNLVLVWIGVLGIGNWKGLGVVGAAIATWIARLVMMLMATVGVFHEFRAQKLPRLQWGDLRIQWQRQKDLFRLGIPTAFQMLLEVGAFAGSTVIAARFGTVSVAAHQIVLQIASMTFMVALGVSQGGAVWVGNSIGAGKFTLARCFARRSIGLSMKIMFCSGVILWFFGSPILSLFTQETAVIVIGAQLLKVAALFQLWDGIQVTSSGVLRGMQDTRSSLIANAIGHWGIGLPLGVLMGFTFHWEILGIWIGLSIGLFVVAMALWWKVWKSGV